MIKNGLPTPKAGRLCHAVHYMRGVARVGIEHSQMYKYSLHDGRSPAYSILSWCCPLAGAALCMCPACSAARA